MVCSKCGLRVLDGLLECPKCGTRLIGDNLSQIPVQVNTVQTADNAGAVAGFVLGLISWFFNLWGIVGILAIAFSVAGISKAKFCADRGKAFAIIGLIFGIINTLYAALSILGRV